MFGRVYALETVKYDCLPKTRGSELPLPLGRGTPKAPPPPKFGEGVVSRIQRAPALKTGAGLHSPHHPRKSLLFVTMFKFSLDSLLGSDCLNGTV